MRRMMHHSCKTGAHPDHVCHRHTQCSQLKEASTIGDVVRVARSTPHNKVVHPRGRIHHRPPQGGGVCLPIVVGSLSRYHALCIVRPLTESFYIRQLCGIECRVRAPWICIICAIRVMAHCPLLSRHQCVTSCKLSQAM
jgi:hypothetical protein